MGTRHLTCVVQDGTFKVAQYGQWDGYPSGQGETILKFLRSTDLGKFKQAVRDTKQLTEEDRRAAHAEFASKEGWLTLDEAEKFKKKYPALSRDTGAQVLSLLPTSVFLDVEFAADGLFCEWAYVIDLDANTLEVYEGFKKETCEGRFKELDDPASEYRPVSLVKTYWLAALPTIEEFVEELEGDG